MGNEPGAVSVLDRQTVAVSKHEKNLRELRCIISRNPSVTLHHCHGGSMAESGWAVGMGQKQNPFLQIPLNAHYHVGDMGIDYGVGVLTWELRFGKQMELLEEVNQKLPYNLWEEARAWEDEHREKSQPSITTRKSTGEG